MFALQHSSAHSRATSDMVMKPPFQAADALTYHTNRRARRA